MVLLRHRHDLSGSHCKLAVKSYPYISKFVDSSQSIDLAGLCELVSTLQHNRGLKIITDGPRDDEDKARFKDRVNRLSQYLALWASKRRKISNLAIIKEDGSIASSSEDSAAALGHYWEPQFSDTPVSISLAKVALACHIVFCPPCIQVTIPFETFEERIAALQDSGVGVDTLPYSCWKFCHQSARVALYNVYLHLLEAKSENLDFLLSRLVFIQKGKEVGDEGGLCLRSPKQTRPLCLANTDCKIVSCMVSLVLTVICSACVSSFQFGGMKGLQMIDHIFAMEAKIVEYIICNLPNSGVFCCDIAAAFPSLSRKYLLWVLRTMRFPRRLYRIIKNLHKPSFAFVCVRNRLFQRILIASGVKQGDPSAMQLFILAYDPLIRFIDASLHPVAHFLYGYCDDLAIVCLNLTAAWSIIMRCFVLVQRISALALNNNKTQFLTTSSTRLEDIELITRLDDRVSASQFKTAIKYLGIFLGHDAIKVNWDSVSDDFISIARFIGSLDCGLVTKISLYNMLAISKLSFVASFFRPNQDILKSERRALQLLLRGPWQAIPDNLLKNLKVLGFPNQVRDLTTLSAASRIRVASSTSKAVVACHTQCLQVYSQSQEVVLCHLDLHLLHQSCLHHVVSSLDGFVLEHPQYKDCMICQKDAYAILFAVRPEFNVLRLFRSRLVRHSIVLDVDARLLRVLAKYRDCISSLGFAPPLTHLRAICNHWCTYSRFGNKNHPCLFGCGHPSDCISHTLACPRFREVFFGICGITPAPLAFEDLVMLDGIWISTSPFRARFILLSCHTCFLVYHSCKHGAPFSSRLVSQKLATYTRRHTSAAKFVNRFKHFESRTSIR